MSQISQMVIPADDGVNAGSNGAFDILVAIEIILDDLQRFSRLNPRGLLLQEIQQYIDLCFCELIFLVLWDFAWC